MGRLATADDRSTPDRAQVVAARGAEGVPRQAEAEEPAIRRLPHEDLLATVSAIGRGFSGAGHRFEPGAGLAVVQESLG